MRVMKTKLLKRHAATDRLFRRPSSHVEMLRTEEDTRRAAAKTRRYARGMA